MDKIQLVIHISRTSVQIAEVFISNQEIIRQFEFELLENSPEGYKKKLNAIFDELDLKEDYTEYSMAWATPKQTLVPMRVYSESSSIAVFNLMFGEEIDDKTIDFNRLMELSMVSVYEIPDWVKSFFIRKFPHIIFKHEHAMTLRAVFQKKTFKRNIIIGFCDNYINISIVSKNELTFSNSFEFQTEEDVLYHLLFVLKQKELTDQEGMITFLCINKETETRAEEVKNQLARLRPFKNIEVNAIESKLKLQTLCV